VAGWGDDVVVVCVRRECDMEWVSCICKIFYKRKCQSGGEVGPLTFAISQLVFL